ncbi:MAG: TMEM175 family protein [Actinomycetota bacterium]|nr:TMEM175 family protein [Actinomycetota bacterium]
MEKGRVEAFSDGVLAVAITLLVLDLHFDTAAGHAGVGQQLRDHWPAFAAYAVSFFQIGVIWVNHHALFSLAETIDRVAVFYNLLLLMFVTTIPFTTSTLAAFLRDGGSAERGAVLLYGVPMTGMAIGFTLILARMVNHGLLRQPVAATQGRIAVVRFGVGVLAYPLVTLISLVWPPLMLITVFVLAVYYMFDQTPIVGRSPAEETQSDRALGVVDVRVDETD